MATVTVSPSSSTLRSTPRSSRVSIGISGSVTVAATSYAVMVITTGPSPLTHRVGAGDALHLGKHPAQRLGVQPVAAGAAADAGERGKLGPLHAADREHLL